jgi:hypothetical protein
MSELRNYFSNWDKMPWPWKQGWLYWEKDPWNFNNPHAEGSLKHQCFKQGYGKAVFTSQVDGGYFDN